MKIRPQGKGVMLASISLAGTFALGVVAGAGPLTAPNPSSAGNEALGTAQAGTLAQKGYSLYMLNCAHCHGADARGDEGPDLHRLDWTDEQIATRIRNGRKGEMTAFAGKLQAKEIQNITAYLRSLNR